MKQLIGEWHGTGTATFPTIDTTQYREHLVIEPHGDDPILKIEQKTWRIHTDHSESLLYWESGFLRQLSATTCEWINAQNNGRTEVLNGTLTLTSDGLILDLSSHLFSNDPRMIQSTRHITVTRDILSYTMAMAIQAHPSLEQHLVAHLQRHHP